MPTNEQLQTLLDDYVTGNISAGDKQLLLTWLNDPAVAQQAEVLLQQELESGRYQTDMLPDVHGRLHARLQTVMDATKQAEIEVSQPATVRRLKGNKTWWAAAAILILLLGAGMYRFLQPRAKPAIVAVPELDVAPGGNKAVLTLADGSTIMLDSAAHGTLAEQGSSTITKDQDGQLVYDAKAPTADLPVANGTPLIFNTLTTPRGGQFRLTLPDGTNVWLNAASSIKYPVAFAAEERRVAIKGEVYFEVRPRYRKKKGMAGIADKLPFIIDVNGKAEVEVLGTHFNINAYDDEEAIRTTLLEGKVSVSGTQPDPDSYRENPKPVILKPGQQAILHSVEGTTSYKLQTTNNIDIDQVMAWKNGIFSFENLSLKEVMRQLARWYNIEVVYEGTPPAVTFVGEMGRDVQLSKVLAFLKGSRINCHMEGTKKLVITN